MKNYFFRNLIVEHLQNDMPKVFELNVFVLQKNMIKEFLERNRSSHSLNKDIQSFAEELFAEYFASYLFILPHLQKCINYYVPY